MAVNPWEGVQQAAWAGRSMMKNGTQTGPLGEQVGKTGWQTRATPQAAPVGTRKEPGAAQGPQFQVSNGLGRPDYGSGQVNQPMQQQNANTRGRRGAFGKGGGGAGITIQNQFGDNAFGIGNVSGQNNAGGIGNIIGDNNTNSGNMGIGNYQAGGPAPTAGATAPAPAPAGPSPAGPAPRGPKPLGGGKGKTPKGLPAGGTPTPLGAGPAAPTPVGSGPKPIGALGTGNPGTPTPAKPQGTKDVRTRKEKIEAVAAQGATPGERAAAQAAQERISGTAPAATPSTPAISAPTTQTPSAPTAQAPSSPPQAQPAKYGNPDAYSTKIGPRMNPDGTEDNRQYTVGGQRGMPAGENPSYGGVQPSAVQPSATPKGKNTIGGNIYPSTPEGDAMRARDEAKQTPAAQAPAEKAKTTAKKTVAKAAAKTPKIRNTSQKPKVAMKADKREKKQPKKGK